MSTEVALLLATAEVQTSDAEKSLDQLSSKFDATSKNVESVGDKLKGAKQALDSTGQSARGVSKDFENLTRSPLEFASSSTQAFQITQKEAGNTGVAFASMARVASSSGRGIEALFRGNVLAAMRDFGMASRAAFNANSPLNFTSNVKASSAALKESAALVTSFSGVLVKAGKDTEVNDQLIEQFGIKASAAFLNPTLATQKFVAGLAQVESAEERATIVQNLFGASAVKMYPIIEGQIALQNRQTAALAALQAAEERNAVAQAALLTETQAATGAITGDILATEGLAVAEGEASAAAQALAVAQTELTAVQQSMAASSGAAAAGFSLSGGAITLLISLAAVLTYGLYNLLTAQNEINVVTKEQIGLIQRQVDISRQELAASQQIMASTQAEANERQRLIDIRKQELANNLNRQKEQEQAINTALLASIVEQERAEAKLHIAKALGVQDLSSYNKAASDAQETTNKARQAVEEYADATGKSEQEVIKTALTHAKLIDSLGLTKGAYTQVVHELGYYINTQGQIVPATDQATLALQRQIGALAGVTMAARQLNSALNALTSARGERIESYIGTIVAVAQGDVKKARALAQVYTKMPGTGDDIKQQRGDEATRRAVEDIFNPPSGGGGGGGRSNIDSLARAQEEMIKALSESATNVWRDQLKRQEDALRRQLENSLISYQEYYKRLEALQQEDIDVQLSKLHEELNAQTEALNTMTARNPPKMVNGKIQFTAPEDKLIGEISKTNAQIEVLEKQRGDVSLKNEDEKNRAILQMDRRHDEARLQLMQEFFKNADEVQKRAISLGLSTYADAAASEFIHAQQVIGKQLIQAQGRLASIDPDSAEAKELEDKIAELAEKMRGAWARFNLDAHDARMKDLGDAQSYTRNLQSIYAQVISITRETEEIKNRALQNNVLRRAEFLKEEATLERAAEAERVRLILNELGERRRVFDEEKKFILSQGGNAKQQIQEIAAIDRQIEAEKRKSAAIQLDIDRQMREQMMQKWKEVAGDLAHIISDGMQGGWKAVLNDFRNLVNKIEEELLNSVLSTIFTGQKQGSNAGGIVGAVVNKILGSMGLGGSTQQQGQTANTSAVTTNTTTTSQNTATVGANTLAIDRLSATLAGGSNAHANLLSTKLTDLSGLTRPRRVTDDSGESGGGVFSFPESSISAIHEATHSMTGAIKEGGVQSKAGIDAAGKANAVALTTVGQGIISTMMQIFSVIANQNTGGGFWSGLLMAAVTGAISGATGGLFKPSTGSSGGGGTNAGKSVDYSQPKGHALGGMIRAINGGRLVRVGEGGYDELILSTDPKYKDRTQALLSDFFARTGMTSAFASGGYASAGGSYIPPTFYGYRSGHNDNRIYNFNHYVTVQGDTRNPQEARKTARQIARDSARFLQGHLSD